MSSDKESFAVLFCVRNHVQTFFSPTATFLFTQAVKQVSVLLGMEADTRLEDLKKAMAVLQHHDAVTGTAKQHVTDDYSERLDQGVEGAFGMLAEAYR